MPVPGPWRPVSEFIDPCRYDNPIRGASAGGGGMAAARTKTGAAGVGLRGLACLGCMSGQAGRTIPGW